MIVIEVFASGCEPAPERRSVDKAADLAAASCAGQACYGVVVAGLCCIWRMWWAEALALSLLMLARCRIWLLCDPIGAVAAVAAGAVDWLV
jgi:hypothetical protein